MLEDINVFAPVGVRETKTDELKPFYTVDQLLDELYDYMELQKAFGDEEYVIKADEVVLMLKTMQYKN